MISIRLENSVSSRLRGKYVIQGRELFRRVFPGVEIKKGRYGCMPDTDCLFGKAISDHEINIWGLTQAPKPKKGVRILLHEMGHVLDYHDIGESALKTHYRESGEESEFRKVFSNIKEREAGATGDYGITTQSGLGVNYRSSVDENLVYSEVFADLFASWVVNEFYNALGPKQVVNGVETQPILTVNGKAWKEFMNPFMTMIADMAAISR